VVKSGDGCDAIKVFPRERPRRHVGDLKVDIGVLLRALPGQPDHLWRKVETQHVVGTLCQETRERTRATADIERLRARRGNVRHEKVVVVVVVVPLFV
jgi:hypothetical protein